MIETPISISEHSTRELCRYVINGEIPYALIILLETKNGEFPALNDENAASLIQHFYEIKQYVQVLEVSAHSSLARLNTIAYEHIKQFASTCVLPMSWAMDHDDIVLLQDLETTENIVVPNHKIYLKLIDDEAKVGINLGEAKKYTEDGLVQIPIRNGLKFHFGIFCLDCQQLTEGDKVVLQIIANILNEKKISRN